MKPRSADRKRIRAERLGRWSEYRAALALLLKGYRIVALRYKTKAGEVDIIARRGDLVIFVEVKARRDLRAGVDAVSYTAERRIENAADHWLRRQSDATRLSLRHDIIVVRPWRWPTHFEGAF
ncbi:YraN family protein [Rhizobium rosettiformans]|uniref:YraN family protein n=1 Tax=Rhizobium rosettiformans TaxID=1368430 RepID=UPI00285E42ED|nr:YraN family protein [Rhizobium rosettiformans]MDR7028247.1 putative endonuclease [Rhizobium rosettiformans]MDR7064471.1 putative endonuclease [Rhizobium rosettiformans]